MAAVGDDAFDVELVDVVLDLLAGADDQDLDAIVLGVIVAKIGQQFVELCGHDNCLIVGMFKGLEAAESPNHFHEQGVRSIKINTAQPSALYGELS